MLRKPLNNESGIVLVIVITFIMIMTVAMVGLFSRNISSALSATDQAKKGKAEALARGAYWKAYNTLSSTATLPTPNPETVTLDGIAYSISYFQSGTAITINVAYP